MFEEKMKQKYSKKSAQANKDTDESKGAPEKPGSKTASALHFW